jgi:hypothetical protein
MASIVTLFYEGVEYNSGNSIIEETLMLPSLDPVPTEEGTDSGNIVIRYVIYQDIYTKYKFFYSSSDRHIFYINDDYISTFVGDIDNNSNNLNGRAYDTKGNYMLFENIDMR